MSTKKAVFLTFSIGAMLLLLGVAVFGQVPKEGGIYRQLSIFSEVFSLVRNNYVEEVPPEQLVDGAFSGVTDAVDEFSFYVPPSRMSAFQKFAAVPDHTGVGVVLSKRYGYGYVISAVAGSPAAESGIEAGDFVEKVDGVPTQKLQVWEIEAALMPADKPVKVTVVRNGMSKRDEFVISPKSYKPAEPALSKSGDVAVLKVPFFGAGTAQRLDSMLEQLRKEGTKKLIVDVRGNASGSFDEAIAAADKLLARGLITAVRGRRVEPKNWQADAATSYDGDVEVLVDSSTAGPAEVFAGAVQGNARGKLVGVPSYGMTVVQKFVTLPSGGGLWVTTGHYTLPDEKIIKERGIRPDVMVDMAAASVLDEKDTVKRDLILEKALSLFSGVPAKAAA